MDTILSPTSPTETTVHGPAGGYTVVFTGSRRQDGIGCISAKAPQPYDDEHLVVGVSIIDGYTVANNDTFRRIIGALGWDVESIAGFRHPDGRTIWLREPAGQ
ncbi:hypothetical protein [Dietzia sp. 179-F 9C3 NHS]|uniref:hypothetical protein n=1 Tax=Dietzia sp. 179-F 9C3 NHS TaxID=3374295 RepID=UPI00387991D0